MGYTLSENTGENTDGVDDIRFKYLVLNIILIYNNYHL